MKIYKPSTPLMVKVRISKQKHKIVQMSLVETNLEEVVQFIEELVKENTEHDPFAKGYKTCVVVRYYQDGNNGRSESISFRGLDPQELEKLILEKLAE